MKIDIEIENKLTVIFKHSVLITKRQLVYDKTTMGHTNKSLTTTHEW